MVLFPLQWKSPAPNNINTGILKKAALAVVGSIPVLINGHPEKINGTKQTSIMDGID